MVMWLLTSEESTEFLICIPNIRLSQDNTLSWIPVSKTKCHIDFIVNDVGFLENCTVIEITFASFDTNGDENLFQ
jgi:hypothetical protein